MIRIFTIASNTFTEVIRQPIYLIILATSMVLILLSPHFTLFAMLENNKIIKDMSLATMFITGVLLAAFSASNVVYKEIENRTILTILTKPVNKISFIIGKYLGLLTSLFVAEYLLTIVLLHVIRTDITEAAYSKSDYPVIIGYVSAIIFSLLMAAFANFFYEKPFISSTVVFALPIFSIIFFALCLVGPDWRLQPIFTNLDTKILLAAFLIFLALMLLNGVATAISTRLSTFPTLLICFAVFLLGLFSDYVFGRHSQDNWFAFLCYSIIPNLQIYWIIDAIIENKKIPFDYICYVFYYTMLFLSAVLSLAVAFFETKETG